MPRMSLPQARNTIRRALRAILDHEPKASEITRLWEYFESSCAYCGITLSKNDRKAHVDHLVHNGPNHIGNRVLSCAQCNGDEKRDRAWLEFLREKVTDEKIFVRRKARIEDWCKNNPCPKTRCDQHVIEQEIANAIAAFNVAVSRLKALQGNTD